MARGKALEKERLPLVERIFIGICFIGLSVQLIAIPLFAIIIESIS